MMFFFILMLLFFHFNVVVFFILMFQLIHNHQIVTRWAMCQSRMLPSSYPIKWQLTYMKYNKLRYHLDTCACCDFRIKTMFGSSLRPVICVRLRIVMSNTYCVVFLFFFVLLPVSLDYPFLTVPSVFSNFLYLHLGTVYTRWGRRTCPTNGTELVYEGNYL